MNCKEAFEFLYQFLDKDGDTVICQEIEVHLKVCRHCCDRYEFERRLKDRCKKTCGEEPCSEALLTRIKNILDKF